MGDVRCEIVDNDVGRALAQLEPPHDFIGNDFQDQAVVLRSASEVLVERLEFDPVVNGVSKETVRSGSDWMCREGRAGAVRDDRHDEVDWKRREQLIEW